MWIQPNIYKQKSAACGSGMNTMYSHNINSFAKWAPSHLVDTRAVYSSVHKAALLSIVSFSRYVCTAAKTRSPLNARVEEKSTLDLVLGFCAGLICTVYLISIISAGVKR